ncbi:MAG: family 16 glycoside hydrolase [Gammaproteobacteria bacterium]
MTYTTNPMRKKGMSTHRWLRFKVAAVWLVIGAYQPLETFAAEELTVNFDDVTQGQLAAGWTIDATNPKGRLAEWRVEPDSDAPTRPKVLTLKAVHDTSGSVFNLCWTRDIAFEDGTIEVKVRANTGKEDQGGGPIWRVRDAKNYYVARYNPLERNFRLYYVKDGERTQIAGARGIDIKTGEWFEVRITQHGTRIEGYLNGKKYLEATDGTFKEAGGVGFWTKADAASSFDDLKLRPASRH